MRNQLKNCRLLQDFILPSLRDQRFGSHLQWDPQDPSVFMLRWIHKAKATWSTIDAEVFLAWDRLKSRPAPETHLDFVNSKQRLRAALRNVRAVQEVESLKGYRRYKILALDGVSNKSKTTPSDRKKIEVEKIEVEKIEVLNKKPKVKRLSNQSLKAGNRVKKEVHERRVDETFIGREVKSEFKDYYPIRKIYSLRSRSRVKYFDGESDEELESLSQVKTVPDEDESILAMIRKLQLKKEIDQQRNSIMSDQLMKHFINGKYIKQDNSQLDGLNGYSNRLQVVKERKKANVVMEVKNEITKGGTDTTLDEYYNRTKNTMAIKEEKAENGGLKVGNEIPNGRTKLPSFSVFNRPFENLNHVKVLNSGQHVATLQRSHSSPDLLSPKAAAEQKSDFAPNNIPDNPKSKRKKKGRSKSRSWKKKNLPYLDKARISEQVSAQLNHPFQRFTAEQSHTKVYPDVAWIEDVSSIPVYHVTPVVGSVEPHIAFVRAEESYQQERLPLYLDPRIGLTDLLDYVNERCLQPLLDRNLDNYLQYMPETELRRSIKQEPQQSAPNTCYDSELDAYLNIKQEYTPYIKQEYTPYEEDIFSKYFYAIDVEDVNECVNMDFVQELNDKARNLKE